MWLPTSISEVFFHLKSRSQPPEEVQLADNLVAIDAADTSTAGQIAGDAWRTVRGLGPDAREGGRAFPLESPCPQCGMPSLWADPVSWAVACGSPDCRSWFAPESVDRAQAPG